MMDFVSILVFFCALIAFYILIFIIRLKRALEIPRVPEIVNEDIPRCEYDEENPEAVIIGGGVVGCALAKALADQNRKVTVIERSMIAGERIVGELLQPGGYLKMKELGISDCIEDIESVDVDGYVIYNDCEKDYVKLLYPCLDEKCDSRYSGRAFHNDRFLMKIRSKLQNEAKYNKRVRFVEGNVTDLIYKRGDDKYGDQEVCGVKYRGKKMTENEGNPNFREKVESQIQTPLVFICDGALSNFSKACLNNSRRVSSKFCGILLVDERLPFEGLGHVILTSPTPVLLYRISPNHVRALIDIPNSIGDSMSNYEYISKVVIPKLPLVISKAIQRAMEIKDNLKVMPNFKLHADPKFIRGCIAIGDSLNIRHPLTGGGMTVAFHDVVLLTNLLKNIKDFQDKKSVLKIYRHFLIARKPLASTINILAHSLYRVFGQASSDPCINFEIKNSCILYFSYGGDFVDGPMSLISGINPSPFSLIYHYLKVGLLCLTRVSLRPFMAAKIIFTILTILYPLLKEEILGFE